MASAINRVGHGKDDISEEHFENSKTNTDSYLDEYLNKLFLSKNLNSISWPKYL